MDADPKAKQALPWAAKADHEPCRLTLEPWRLTLETWRLTLDVQVHPGAMGANYVALDTHLGALRLTLEPWVLTMEPWMLTLEPRMLTLQPRMLTLKAWRVTLESWRLIQKKTFTESNPTPVSAVWMNKSILLQVYVRNVINFFFLSLKVLSSEMDPANIRLIRQIFIKGRGAAFFQKNPPVPHCLKALQRFRAT